jgi:hypothetical protein
VVTLPLTALSSIVGMNVIVNIETPGRITGPHADHVGICREA